MVNGASSADGEKPEFNSSMNATERLLDAWLQVSTLIRNDKFVKELTYNESIICKLLADDAADGGEGLTATELCGATQMKKSQMNRTLTAMEDRGLIARSTSKEDHRKQLVKIKASQMARFMKQHERIIEFVESIRGELGQKRSLELTNALRDLAAAVRKVSAAS